MPKRKPKGKPFQDEVKDTGKAFLRGIWKGMSPNWKQKGK